MSDPFSKEGAEIKERFLRQYNEWEPSFFKEKRTGITKGRARRGLYSFLLSPDDVHMDYVDKRLTEGADTKSIMGGLGGRVQKMTSGGSSAYGIIDTDSLHHQNPHNAYGRAAKVQDQKNLRDFLKISADQGVYYGEAEQNLKGTSLDSRSHTGSRGKPGSRFNPTLTEGPEGKSELSAHPRGTTDTDVVLPEKQFKSGKEMFDLSAEIRKMHGEDLALGQAADATRRAKANAILRANGIIGDDIDVFSKDASNESIRKAQKFFKGNEAAMTEVAKAFDPMPAKAISRNRKAAMALAAGGLAGFSLLGTAASAAETVIRGKTTLETKNPLDAVQTALSGASFVADLVPIAGELVSTPADAINIMIDQERSGGAKRIRGRSGAKRAIQKLQEELNSPYGLPE